MRRTPFLASFPEIVLLAVSWACYPLHAQAPVAGPVEAVVYDAPSKNFRAITGALGSALLSPGILDPMDFGAVSPRLDYGIAFRAGGAQLITNLSSSGPSIQDLPGSFTVPDGVAWSGDGTVAVFYSSSGNWLQTISALPGSPVINSAVSTAALGGSIAAVTTTVDGKRTFVAITGGATGVYELTSEQNLVPVLPMAAPVALSISGDSNVLYALDAVSHQINQLNLADLTSQSWPSGLLDPVAVFASSDATNRSVVYAVGRNDQLLIAYDASSHHVVNQTSLDFQPTGISILGTHSFILRNRQNDQESLWTFAAVSEPAAYFVPLAPSPVIRRPRILPRSREIRTRMPLDREAE